MSNNLTPLPVEEEDELRGNFIRVLKAATDKNAREPLAYLNDLLEIAKSYAAAQATAAQEREYWKPILGCPGYEVSSTGRVRSSRGLLRLSDNGHGYKVVSLNIEGKRKNWLVHRLVGAAFISNPENLPMINHKDAVKTHNCAGNLEWCTAKHNSQHAQYYGLMKNGSKLTYELAQEIRALEGTARRVDIARDYGLTTDTVRRIWRGEHHAYADAITGAETPDGEALKLYTIRCARPLLSNKSAAYPYRGKKLHLITIKDYNTNTRTLCNLVVFGDETAQEYDGSTELVCVNCTDVLGLAPQSKEQGELS